MLSFLSDENFNRDIIRLSSFLFVFFVSLWLKPQKPGFFACYQPSNVGAKHSGSKFMLLKDNLYTGMLRPNI